MISNGTTYSIVLLFPICMCMCARVNTLQVETRWPKMNVAIEGGREKGIYACTFFMATQQAEKHKSILYVAVILQHISFGDERKGKET